MHRLDVLLYVLVFLAAATAVEGGILLLAGRGRARARLAARLRRYGARLAGEGAGDPRSIRRDPRRGVRSPIPGYRTLELLLYRAGIALPVEVFLAGALALGGAGAGFGLFVRRSPLLAGLLASLALVPFAVAALRRRRRMRDFDRQLPEAIELLVRALRAGHSVRVGFQLVGEELPDPIGLEFAQVAEEIGFGMDLGDALRGLGRRVDHPDVPFFVNAVMIQRETGGNLVEILQNMSRMVRQRLHFFGRVRTLLAQVKLTANMLAVVPVVLVGSISLVNADYVAPLFETVQGRTLVWVAAGLVATGWLLCRRLGVVKF